MKFDTWNIHRLSGLVLLVPAVNYWWPSLPTDISESAFKKLDLLYQSSFWVAHNLPFLFCGWMKQNLFGSSPIVPLQETTPKPEHEIIEQQQRPIYGGGSDAVCFSPFFLNLLYVIPPSFKKIIMSSISFVINCSAFVILLECRLVWGRLTKKDF
jgi:hypothetical protein